MALRTRSLALSALIVFSCGVESGLPDQQNNQNQNAGTSETNGFVPGTRVHKLPVTSPGQENPLRRATAHVSYYGGRVISNVQVVEVLYGAGTYLSEITSTASPSMASFYGGVTNSPYLDWMSEYNTSITDVGGTAGTNQQIGRGTYAQTVQITPSAANSGTTVDDTNIQAELAAQLQAGTLPPSTLDSAGNPNTIYMVHFPQGVTVTQGGTASCSSGGFCAYHGTFQLNGQDVYYGIFPDMSAGSGCDLGCGSNASQFNNQTSVSSHELAEAITDAEVGIAATYGPPLAWYDSTNGEVGDICNAQQGTIVGGDGVTYVVQKEWSNTDNACIVQHATVTNDFSISASPTSLSLVQNGSAGSVTVSTAVTSGSAETITLSVSGVPSGATASFSSSTISAGSSSTLTLHAGTAAAGTYTLTVTGAGTTTHSTTISFAVTVPVNDFSISASPSSVSAAQGTSTTTTIGTAVTSGSTQSVTLSVSGVPTGATASFSASTVSAGSSSTLTLNAGTAAAGTYSLTVTGTGTKTHSTTVSFTVTAPVTNDFSIAASPTSLSATQNAKVTTTISTAVTSGSAQTVSLSVSGLPSGATASFSASSVTAGSGSTLTISTGSAAAGTYSLTVKGTGTSTSHSVTVSLAVTSTTSSGGVTNGGFESGTLSGWTASGVDSVSTTAHSGTYSAMVGSSNPSSNSSIVQTFVVPSGAKTLTVWYDVVCNDTVKYDWASATVKDVTTGKTYTLIPKTCTLGAGWRSASLNVTAGHKLTVTLSNHDDNYPGDPTYTLYDDVTVH